MSVFIENIFRIRCIIAEKITAIVNTLAQKMDETQNKSSLSEQLRVVNEKKNIRKLRQRKFILTQIQILSSEQFNVVPDSIELFSFVETTTKI